MGSLTPASSPCNQSEASRGGTHPTRLPMREVTRVGEPADASPPRRPTSTKSAPVPSRGVGGDPSPGPRAGRAGKKNEGLRGRGANDEPRGAGGTGNGFFPPPSNTLQRRLSARIRFAVRAARDSNMKRPAPSFPRNTTLGKETPLRARGEGETFVRASPHVKHSPAAACCLLFASYIV